MAYAHPEYPVSPIDAFARLLRGQEDVALHDGSLAEWARDESLPMETGR